MSATARWALYRCSVAEPEVYDGNVFLMTRFIVLVLALFLTTSETYAEWVEIDGSISFNSYVDPDTIRSKGNLAKMWTLNDHRTNQTTQGKSHLSEKLQIAYDCAEEQFRVIAVYLYSGQMGSGEIVLSFTAQTGLEPVMPGTIANTKWKFACKRLGTNGPIF